MGSADTPLRELGVRGGDLLWLLSPTPAPPEPAAPAPAAAAEAGAKRARDSNDAPTGNPTTQPQQPQQPQQPADKGKQAVAGTGAEGQHDGAEARAVEQQDEAEAEPELEPLPPSQRLPAYLLRTLQASWAPPSGPAGILLLAAHAAMLETGFVPHWPAGSGVYEVPRSCWASSSVCRIQYTLQPSNGDDNSSSAMDEAEEAANSGTGAAEQGAAAGPACTLQCSSMGGGAVVLAVSTQRHARHLALQAGAFVQPLEPAATAGGTAAGSDGAGTSSSSSTAAAAAQGASSAVQLLPDGGLALGGHLQLGAAAAKQLWTRLKDGLAFPMLLAAYAEAGLAPPAGLLALPEELKQRVLEALGVSVGVVGAGGNWLGTGREEGEAGRLHARQGRLLNPGFLRFEAKFSLSLSPGLPTHNRIHLPSLPRLHSRTTWPRCAAPAASCATWPPRTPCGARSLTASSRVPRSGMPSK